MRLYLAAALLVASVAVAQDDPYASGVELDAIVKAKCADGCVVFSRKEADALQGQLNEILARKQKEAFQAGVVYQKQACASLI